MSAVTATLALQLYLSGAWADLSLDGQASLTCEYGIHGGTPNDRIADTGTCHFALNNSERNSAAVRGYYSPLSSSKRTGYDVQVPVRLLISSGGNSSYKFRGRLSDVIPVAGKRGARLANCVAVDWMDEAAEIDLPDIATQQNKRSDQLVTTILDALAAGDQPVARSIETGLESYAWSLDGGATGQRPKVREVLDQVCRSEGGYGYVKGDSTQGGTFMFENRHHRASNPTIQITLAETDIDALEIASSRDDIYSSVQVLVHPTRVDAAATTVLWALQTTTTLIQPGETNNTIFGPFSDPSNNDLIGGTATVDPVATTDYLMNAAADGGGADLTANFTVSASRTGLGVRWTITNNGTQAGYVTKLQVRGKGIYRYDTVIEKTISGSYGTRPLAIEMPFQNDVNVGTDFATYLSGVLSSLYSVVRSVRFTANKNASLMAAAILREPGDRIAITESVTGLNAQFTINHVRLDVSPRRIITCTWGLEPASSQRYWLWGIAGSSEWGTTTVYGF